MRFRHKGNGVGQVSNRPKMACGLEHMARPRGVRRLRMRRTLPAAVVEHRAAVRRGMGISPAKVQARDDSA